MGLSFPFSFSTVRISLSLLTDFIATHKANVSIIISCMYLTIRSYVLYASLVGQKKHLTFSTQLQCHLWLEKVKIYCTAVYGFA
uniref:Uncharacterized protein n=1 Tax=Arundo donax TaxID=35708 RepID=A0A0A9FK15_ARUDO